MSHFAYTITGHCIYMVECGRNEYHTRMNPMSVHVRFETPSDLADKIYELIRANQGGRIKKGSNEVTKSAERGTAQFVILAEDVNPPELLAPIDLRRKGHPIRIRPKPRIPCKRNRTPNRRQDRFHCYDGDFQSKHRSLQQRPRSHQWHQELKR